LALQSLINSITILLDLFVPKGEKSEQDRYRMRFTVAILLAFLIYSVLLSFTSLFMPILPEGRQLLTDFCLTTALGISVGLLILRVTGSQSACLHMVIFALLVAMINVSVKLGGIYSPAAPVGLIVPALATIILGARAGFVWASILIMVFVGFYRADLLGFEFPSIMLSENSGYGIFMGLTSAIVANTLIILLYEYTTQKLNQRLQQAHDNYLFQANHDSLTGLANRRHFIQIIDSYINHPSSGFEHFAVLFFDLNHFKKANDLYDHQFGDEVLIQVANRLRLDSRSTDYAARWGGDEFALLLPGIATEEQASSRITNLLATLRQPITIRNVEYCTDASVGYALFPAHGRSHKALIHHADHEMYGVKRQQSF
jgi:diguanylate cyclase (GGDEF)-like protein